MTTSPTPSSASTSSDKRSALRIEIRRPPAGRGVDGAWWPQSRDLQVEAADLIDNFPLVGERIHRLLFSRPDWDDVVHDGHGVRRVHAGRGPVKVGSFPADDTQQVVLTMAGGYRITLAVLPSDTPADEARRAMQAVVA